MRLISSIHTLPELAEYRPATRRRIWRVCWRTTPVNWEEVRFLSAAGALVTLAWCVLVSIDLLPHWAAATCSFLFIGGWLVAIALAVQVHRNRVLRQVRWRLGYECRHCHYDLRGCAEFTHPACPECGKALEIMRPTGDD